MRAALNARLTYRSHSPKSLLKPLPQASPLAPTVTQGFTWPKADSQADAGTALKASLPTRAARQSARTAQSVATATSRQRREENRATSAPAPVSKVTTATSPGQDQGSARGRAPRDRTAALGLPSVGSVQAEGTATSLATGSSGTRLRSARDLALSLLMRPLLAARVAQSRFYFLIFPLPSFLAC